MTIYAILQKCENDYFISQECYDSFEKAKHFIETRSDNPEKSCSSNYMYSSTSSGNQYYIRELTLK